MYPLDFQKETSYRILSTQLTLTVDKTAAFNDFRNITAKHPNQTTSQKTTSQPPGISAPYETPPDQNNENDILDMRQQIQ
jgi:hypothetical protein